MPAQPNGAHTHVDHVGSLVRPQELTDAWFAAEAGTLDQGRARQDHGQVHPRGGRAPGGHRPRIHHRRRVPARRLVARLPRRGRGLRLQAVGADLPERRGRQDRGAGTGRDQEDEAQAQHRRRRFRVLEGRHQEDAQGHHADAVAHAFRAFQSQRRPHASIPTWRTIGATWSPSTRRRSRRSPRPAANCSSSTRCRWRCAATTPIAASRAPRARTRTSWSTATSRSSMTPSPAAQGHARHPASLPRQHAGAVDGRWRL